MIESSKLVIMPNKVFELQGLLILLSMLVGTIMGYYMLDTFIPFLSTGMLIFLRALIIVVGLFFVVLVPFIINQCCDTRPIASMDEHGVHTRYCGFVPWHEVRAVEWYSIAHSPLVLVGLWVHDPRRLYKQSGFAGKMSLYWSYKLNNPLISFEHCSVDPQDVVEFAKFYIGNVTL